MIVSSAQNCFPLHKISAQFLWVYYYEGLLPTEGERLALNLELPYRRLLTSLLLFQRVDYIKVNLSGPNAGRELQPLWLKMSSSICPGHVKVFPHAATLPILPILVKMSFFCSNLVWLHGGLRTCMWLDAFSQGILNRQVFILFRPWCGKCMANLPERGHLWGFGIVS